MIYLPFLLLLSSVIWYTGEYFDMSFLNVILLVSALLYTIFFMICLPDDPSQSK